MYREHAGPPPPDPYAAARKNAQSCAYMQLGVVAVNTITIVLVTLQLGPQKFLQHLSDETKTAMLLGAVGYVLFTAAWAGLNAFGLLRRSKLAHWSSVAFGIFTIFSCFSWMFGAGLIFLLFKKEMKGYYDARPTGL